MLVPTVRQSSVLFMRQQYAWICLESSMWVRIRDNTTTSSFPMLSHFFYPRAQNISSSTPPLLYILQRVCRLVVDAFMNSNIFLNGTKSTILHILCLSGSSSSFKLLTTYSTLTTKNYFVSLSENFFLCIFKLYWIEILLNFWLKCGRGFIYACSKEGSLSINNITIICGAKIHPSPEGMKKGFCKAFVKSQ